MGRFVNRYDGHIIVMPGFGWMIGRVSARQNPAILDKVANNESGNRRGPSGIDLPKL